MTHFGTLSWQGLTGPRSPGECCRVVKTATPMNLDSITEADSLSRAGIRSACSWTGLTLLVLLASACASAPAAPSERDGRDARSDSTNGRARPTVVRTSPDVALPAVGDVDRLRVLEVHHGEATYYADKFEGRRTASGIPFRQSEPYAAHRTLPFGTVVRVTNERNGRSVIVRVVDRGPWGSIAKRRNTIIDLSRSAAEELGYIQAGRTPVKVEVLLLGTG
jgi:rare lipoprotein A